MRKLPVVFVLMLLLNKTYAQVEAEEAKETESFLRHSFSLTIGHEHAFSGRSESGKREVAVLPFWGLDYNFSINENWKIGLHTDFIIESFKVEKNLPGGENETVERTRPIAPAVMGIFKPDEHWSFALGMGGEFAKEENYALTRAAVEYGVEIRKAWEVFGSLQYDFRWDAYDTWTIGIGISKSFGASKK